MNKNKNLLPSRSEIQLTAVPRKTDLKERQIHLPHERCAEKTQQVIFCPNSWYLLHLQFGEDPTSHLCSKGCRWHNL